MIDCYIGSVTKSKKQGEPNSSNLQERDVVANAIYGIDASGGHKEFNDATLEEEETQ